uniref:Sulfotransferase 3 n=1 Tax=Photinus pyralis TaxID=7054 RepID=A0A173GP44_PHOPY|nr:sulfotransferase 3 [Photinus pyralis]
MPHNIQIGDILNNRDENSKRKFPYEVKIVDPDTNKELLNVFTGEHTGFVQVGPQKYFFPSGYEKVAEKYYNFEIRPDDVWIVTFPRSGTTWTQEMVWLIANEFDYNTAARVPLNERFPFLEFSMCVHPKMKAQFLQENSHSIERQNMIEDVCTEAWKILENWKGRRFIKTHLPFSLLPPNLLTSGCKVIYVARNPKDVMVSYYYLNRLFRTQGYRGDFPTFAEYFLKDMVHWTPFWSHLQEGWDLRSSKNLLFLFYDQMNKLQTIQKVSNFLGKEIDDDQLTKIQNHLQIENFKNNKSLNANDLLELGILYGGEEGFVRKGKTGSHTDLSNVELDEKIDKWVKKNLQMTNIPFERM